MMNGASGTWLTAEDMMMLGEFLGEPVAPVTAEITVRFVAPVRTGDELTFSGWITRNRGKVFLTEGEVVGSNGQVYATSTGKYLEPREGLKAELMQSID